MLLAVGHVTDIGSHAPGLPVTVSGTRAGDGDGQTGAVTALQDLLMELCCVIARHAPVYGIGTLLPDMLSTELSGWDALMIGLRALLTMLVAAPAWRQGEQEPTFEVSQWDTARAYSLCVQAMLCMQSFAAIVCSGLPRYWCCSCVKMNRASSTGRLPWCRMTHGVVRALTRRACSTCFGRDSSRCRCMCQPRSSSILYGPLARCCRMAIAFLAAFAFTVLGGAHVNLACCAAQYLCDRAVIFTIQA